MSHKFCYLSRLEAYAMLIV